MPSANTWCVPVPLHSSQSAMALLHSNHKAYLITLMVRPGMQTIIRTLRDLSLILSGSQLWARPKVHCTTSRCYNDVFSQSWFLIKYFFFWCRERPGLEDYYHTGCPSATAGNRFQFSTSNHPASVCTSRAWILPPVQGQPCILKILQSRITPWTPAYWNVQLLGAWKMVQCTNNFLVHEQFVTTSATQKQVTKGFFFFLECPRGLQTLNNRIVGPVHGNLQ